MTVQNRDTNKSFQGRAPVGMDLSNEAVAEMGHPVLGRFRTLTPPVKLSATPSTVTRSAPTLGQHTRDVLREAGLDEAEIEGLLGENRRKLCEHMRAKARR